MADPTTDPLARTEAAASAPSAPVAQELPAGTRVGRYVIVEKLGAGGMGVVYAATDEELDRRVALKFLQAEMRGSYGSGAAMQRLQREAQVMAKLSHPNVVAVFDVGTFEGQVFLAMELVEGLNLRSWLQAKHRSAREVVATYVQAGRGLEAAHAAGILHRDFKPENVLVDPTGRVRVLDFGLARVDDSLASARAAPPTRSSLTSSSQPLRPITTEGELIGTPAYMAPEQLQGTRVDARSDQFAFCVALYEALSGERPFEGLVLRDLVANVTAGRIRAPSRSKTLPRGVRRVLLRGLRTEPDARFASMGDLLHALDKAVAARRNFVVLGVALAASAAALLLALRPARPPLCVGAEQEIGQSWGEPERRAVEQGLLGSGSPRAKEVWERIRPRLDDYAAHWAQMRTESCQATRVRGTQSDEALDLRAACLDQRQRELAATVTLLTRADAKTVDRAVGMAQELADIGQCADVASLRAPYAEPKDPAKKRAVDAVRDELAQAAALIRARKNPEAEAVSRRAAGEAHALENLPLEALASWDVATALVARGKDEEARGFFLDSALEANRARDDETEAKSWIALVKTVGYDLGRPDESDLYAKLADSAIERAGSKEAQRALLLRHRADVLYAKGKLDESLVLYKEVLERSTRAYGARSTQAARSQIDIADIDAQRGHVRAALPLYQDAVATIAAVEGDGSPTLGVALIDYTETLMLLGEDDLAIENGRRGLALMREGDIAHARMRLLLACALLGRGNVAEAKAEAVAAFAENDATSGADAMRRGIDHSAWAVELVRRHLCDDALPEADTAIADLSGKNVEKGSLRGAQEVRAICLDRTGRAKEGLALGQTVLAGEDAESPPLDSNLLMALLAVGEGALNTRDAARAVVTLERAVMVAERMEGYVEEVADAHLDLARALLASHGNAARARSLAELAAHEYDATHLADLANAARAVAAP